MYAGVAELHRAMTGRLTSSCFGTLLLWYHDTIPLSPLNLLMIMICQVCILLLVRSTVVAQVSDLAIDLHSYERSLYIDRPG